MARFLGYSQPEMQSRGTPRGIPQGSPLGPMLFNAYMARFVLKPWARRHGQWPVVAYADDLVVLTRSGQEAAAALSAIKRLLKSAGFKVKPRKTRVIDANSSQVSWLGHTIVRHEAEYRFGIPVEHWKSAEEQLLATSRVDDNRADKEAVQWLLQYHGPAWESRELEPALTRLGIILAKSSHVGRPGEDEARWMADMRRQGHKAL